MATDADGDDADVDHDVDADNDDDDDDDDDDTDDGDGDEYDDVDDYFFATTSDWSRARSSATADSGLRDNGVQAPHPVGQAN